MCVFRSCKDSIVHRTSRKRCWYYRIYYTYYWNFWYTKTQVNKIKKCFYFSCNIIFTIFRLSDFQVHEIELDGTVVHLTSRTVPEKEIEETHSKGIYMKLMYTLILNY